MNYLEDMVKGGAGLGTALDMIERYKRDIKEVQAIEECLADTPDIKKLVRAYRRLTLAHYMIKNGMKWVENAQQAINEFHAENKA